MAGMSTCTSILVEVNQNLYLKTVKICLRNFTMFLISIKNYDKVILKQIDYQYYTQMNRYKN